MVGDFTICLLAFFNIFIYLLFIFLFFYLKKKRDEERGPEGGAKRRPKGGSKREGPRFVYTLF